MKEGKHLSHAFNFNPVMATVFTGHDWPAWEHSSRWKVLRFNMSFHGTEVLAVPLTEGTFVHRLACETSCYSTKGVQIGVFKDQSQIFRILLFLF